MMSEPTHSPVDDLSASLERWTSVGLITPEQAGRISSFEETGSAPATRATVEVPPRRLTTVMELVSYLGIVLVVASGGLAVSRLWHGLGVGGRAGVGAAVAALGFLGGRAVMGLRDESSTRLGWFLWLCGTGGVAMATAVVADRVSSHSAGWTVLVTGLTVLALSVGLWRNLERPLQFASALGGLGLSIGGLFALTHWQPTLFVVGVVTWALSVGLGVLALKVVHPSLMALLVAQIGAFEGAMSMTSTGRALGFTLGTLTAVAGVTLGLRMRVTPVMGLGVLTFFVFLVRLLSFYLRGPATILVAFAIGLGLVGTMIWRATRTRSTTPDAAPRRWASRTRR